MKSKLPIFAAMALAVHVLAQAFPARAFAAAELVMFESVTCEWCDRFHREIGPIYPKTRESTCAPMRRVDIHAPVPDDLKAIKDITYTPTFVLLEDGREVGRITGYPGEHFFWSLLDGELKNLARPCPRD